MKAMEAGRLTKRIEIQEDAGTGLDAAGSPTRSWTTRRTTWASIEPLSQTGRETFQGAQIRPDLTHKIVVRFRSDVAIKPSWRVLYGTRVFEIGVIAHTEEAQRETIILAKELVE